MLYFLYHSNCFDGFGAAISAWRLYGDQAKYIPVSYGKPAPETPEAETIYLLDFCYPKKIIEELATRCIVRVLDHHKSAQEALKGYPFAGNNINERNLAPVSVNFDMNRSGAVIAWEWFHPDKPIPLLLQYIQDRDLWLFNLPQSEEYHAWLRSYPFDFTLWNGFLEAMEAGNLANLSEGVAIKRSADQTVAMMCKNYRYAQIAGHRAVTVNATCHWSEVGHYLLKKHPKAAFAASFGTLGTGKVMWSLRSQGDFDVSEIAKQFNGGGHKNASGCADLVVDFFESRP
jgi:oligoribonuclease NrnB/cAMP/cGMP phosphodiesterase (DHH superfamily)